MPTTTNPFDELAAMFLTGSDGSAKPLNGGTPAADAGPPDTAPHATAVAGAFQQQHNGLSSPAVSRAGVELLIVGHLPVRGNLWVTPYADLRSREIGSVALLRLDGGEPSIQLLRAPQQTASMAMRGSMISAIDELAPLVDYWILRAPSSLPVESLPAIKLADQITILTSADEPAVVAAYQIIKDAAQLFGESIEHLPPISLAVVGTDRATADMVVERLTRATTSFLGMDIQLAMCLQRIDAGVKSTRYIGFADQQPPDVADVIASLDRARVSMAGVQDDAEAIAGRLYAERDAQRDAEHVRQAERLLRAARLTPPPASPRAAAPPIQQPPPAPDASDPKRVEDPRGRSVLRSDDELSKWIAAARSRLASESTQPGSATPTAPAPSAPPSSSPQPRPPIKLAPKPAMAIEAKQPPKESEPARDGKPVPLCSYINVNGGSLKLLPVRMPGHERIEIAADSAGRLHVIGHEHSLRELRIVEQWTRTHRELLIMACPHHPVDSLATPHCHIFTDRPASLADLHGADMSLHVLAPVVVNGHTGWYAAALNAV